MSDLSGRHVFISGPMSGRDCYNKKAFDEAEMKAISLGATYTFNPCCMIDEYKDKSHEECMLFTLHELTSGEYDSILPLDGWQSSKGATVEVADANACGIEMVSLDGSKD